MIDAGYVETAATKVLLSAGQGSSVIDGATSTHALSREEEAAYFQLNASKGDSLGIGISNLIVANGSCVVVNVYRINRRPVGQHDLSPGEFGLRSQ
ncbi:hypothetical protein ROV86_14490 [Stenotrophomonas pavanii]|uniref:hypothetical protein n=1 Tax=Stenotrophomonas pavanii TaxID=487698 RepID=UPI002893E3D5|nr:hypothetical protein [Stenotrophomonas pavanii]MDT3529304.1 hypothetical protein [Stenotrophomonas pavanii]